MTKTNWMTGGSEFANFVTEFMELNVYNVEIRTRCDREVKALTNAIEGFEKLRGSIYNDQVDGMISEAKAKIEEFRKERNKTLKRWKPDENDKELYDNFYATGRDFYVRGGCIAIGKWFIAHNVQIGDEDMTKIYNALAGESPNSVRNWVNTGMMNATKKPPMNFYKTFYGKIVDMMVAKNAIRPANFSEVVRESYAPKARKSAK